MEECPEIPNQEGADILDDGDNLDLIVEDKGGRSERKRVKTRENTEERKRRKENSTIR